VIDVVGRSLDIFQEDYIRFNADDKVIEAELDRTQLIRVITNLVTNALHAVEGKKQPKILVKIRQDEKFVMIDVVDNGKGISEEFEDLIFEPKFTTKNSGMGLGLPMIKNIVENYGGSISFLSRRDIGTTFTVELPKKEES
jgi:signal transduction histidine kinase